MQVQLREEVAGECPNDRTDTAGVQLVAAQTYGEFETPSAGCDGHHPPGAGGGHQSQYTGTAPAPQTPAARLQSGGDTAAAWGAHHPGDYEKTCTDTGDLCMSVIVEW